MPTYSAEWDPGDYRANNETRNRMGFGGTEHGAEQYASRSRMLGSEAQQRGAYQSDFGQSNESRGHQYAGLGLLQGAASGTAPSQAAIEAKLAGDRARAANVSMAGSVKGGPGARVAAMRAAMAGNAASGQQTAAQAAAARAGEMATARGQYAQAASATRGQDLGATQIQQQNELTQRGLNDSQQRFYEQQGYNTQVQQQNNQLQQQQLGSQNWAQGRAATMSDEQFGFSKDMTWAKAGAGAAQGGLGAAAGAMAGSGTPDPNTTSDAAAKNLVPMGSLAGFANPTFDKLTPGGGMDVVGSLKAHSNFATQYQRDPSGGMMSDWRSKDVMYSPGEIKTPRSLDDAMQDSFQRTDGAQYGYFVDPYQREPEMGVAGARRGYAAERAGQPGGMFGAQQGAEAAPERGAPGSNDWAKYGEPGKKDGAVDWAKGGTTKPASGGGGLALGSLAGILGGFAGAPTMRSDMTSKNEVMYSDDKTKLAAAFEAGKAAKPEVGGKVKDAIKGATGEDAKKIRDIAIAAGGGIAPSPAAAPMGLYAGPATDALVETTKAKPEEARAAMPGPGVIDYTAPVFGPIGGALLTRYARSDEKAKNVIDLDETSMRDGSSDPRTNSFDKNFRRDTPADQKRVKRGVEDKAGKDADAMMAGFGASMKRGPSARVDDIDSDDKPDLSSAAKAAAGAIPDDAMYSAMKSMKPSLYSYKPGFKPPEQHPGEVQAGPMANPMAKDPVAGTAIEREPSTGLLAIDKDKALKLTMGSLAVLAEDLEAMKRKLGGGKKKS